MTSEERNRRLGRVTRELVQSYHSVGGINRIGEKNLPNQGAVVAILADLLAVVYPGYRGDPVPVDADLEVLVGARLDKISRSLSAVIESTLKFCHQLNCQCEQLWEVVGDAAGNRKFKAAADYVTMNYLDELPAIRSLVDLDVQAAFEGDPAATNREEVVLCYPGILAISVHRLAHPLQKCGVPLVPRMMSEWAHQKSGVDIHPGASIGRRFFIDHGTGVVVGETAEIGDDVKIYQGVTLGARSFRRNPDGTLIKGGKRHPTIGNRVVIYANATILGGDTVIGEGVVVGGGSWLTGSVPSGQKVSP